ncbi:hypothetical protein W97_02304 [Coniosporium apollinis CBS 100218]|uniref:Major facilitator superfamily (MFS) profile domain-containing protein n=1 Tax=Coniosporium apollinis (strain CBS 100218) TaxID=1168221 RepID=R7YMF1_CONA1|nr:uncharacterized protein W97_02304 [Coniosporium apollinis CBS 100218]EON63077.1 hypothetical protein W97_02304 [Coniosporium apollinis CBS 100218]
MADIPVARVEAPVTLKAYFLCAFAAFGGILFGYDSGYISGVLGMDYFKYQFGGPVPADFDHTSYYDGETYYMYQTWQKSLITAILSAGTFLGAVVAGGFADWLGRRTTIIMGCAIFLAGVILQTASTTVPLLIVGRFVAGIGVGFVSAIIILHMSEIAPKAVRGMIVAGYSFAVTVGLLLASCVTYATKDRMDTGSYRIPIAIQAVYALILGVGLFLLPESPRWYVKKGRLEKAQAALCRIRGQPQESEYIRAELDELIANYEHEIASMQGGWMDCFKGGWKPNSNLRRVVIGISMQMFQQWTGVNFIFYYGTTFFQQAGVPQTPFIIGIITTVVNVGSTPLSFWTIERFGRRPLLIFGALGMLTCEFIIAIVGTAAPNSGAAGYVLVVFVCIYISFFASTWGPAAWVIIGEIYPLPIRAKGVALSTASNWLWNFIIGYITPYMVDPSAGNLGAKVFFVWGSTCAACLLFAYFFVPETKGLSLEQVDQMMAECSPRQSAKWVPHTTFATEKRRASEAGVVMYKEMEV